MRDPLNEDAALTERTSSPNKVAGRYGSTGPMTQTAAQPLIHLSSTAADVSPQEFLNRDLSWLEFNRRVLHEALDERTPLLERVRFLGIFTNNLDEFFMKRLATLRRQAVLGSATLSADGRTPAEVLAAVRKAVQPMLDQQARC